jgi:flagellar basal-body rod protein FlgB
MSVFNLVSQHMDWLGQRYAVAAGNVANLDTPGYRSKEVSAFAPELARQEQLDIRHALHLQVSGVTASTTGIVAQASSDETHGRNNVSVENEMRTIGETSRQMNLETSLLRIFHRMTISSVKGA